MDTVLPQFVAIRTVRMYTANAPVGAGHDNVDAYLISRLQEFTGLRRVEVVITSAWPEDVERIKKSSDMKLKEATEATLEVIFLRGPKRPLSGYWRQ